MAAPKSGKLAVLFSLPSMAQRGIAVPRSLKYLLLAIVAVPLLLIAVLLALWWLQPVPITDWRVLLNAVTGQGAAIASEQIERRLQPPPGFSLSIYARDLPMVRMLHVTAAGDVLATRPRAGEVVLLERDRDGDGVADGRRVLLSGLDRPHGIDVANGWLYIGENTAVGRVRFDESSGRVDGDYARIVSGLTGAGNHWTKTVRIGPDGKL
jgi:glucose/arabinose dehydrogenase